MASIRSKHNNLLNYFICDHRHLSKAYVRKCEKFFAAAGPLENDIRKPRCSHEVAKPLGTRLRTQQKQRAGSIPPALKQGHGRAYYTNGPLVAGASSLPAKPLSRNKK